MPKFILAQLILSMPGAVVSLAILLLIPDNPLLFITVSTILQAPLLIFTSIVFGEQVQRWVGINLTR